jgi:hypothetical protein
MRFVQEHNPVGGIRICRDRPFHRFTVLLDIAALGIQRHKQGVPIRKVKITAFGIPSQACFIRYIEIIRKRGGIMVTDNGS